MKNLFPASLPKILCGPDRRFFLFGVAWLIMLFSAAGAVPAQQTMSFTNSAPIVINDNAPASLYPSVITVSGIASDLVVTRVTVELNSLNHDRMNDVNVLLVSPSGRMSTVISDLAGDAGFVDLEFDQLARTTLPLGLFIPFNDPVASGVYLPYNEQNYLGQTLEETLFDDYPSPGPGLIFDVADFNKFICDQPNGDWRLFVVDDETGETGSIDFGWTLNLTLGKKRTVTSTADDNQPGTLRNEVQMAEPGSVIVFDSALNQPIELINEIQVADDLTLLGNGRDQTMITANNLDRIFTVDVGKKLVFLELTLTGGTADFGGLLNNLGDTFGFDVRLTKGTANFFGALVDNGQMASFQCEGCEFSEGIGNLSGCLENAGYIQLRNSSVTNCTALDPKSNGRSGAALFNRGIADFNRVTISGNQSLGGGIENGAIVQDFGDFLCVSCTIAANTANGQGSSGGINLFGGDLKLIASVVADNLIEIMTGQQPLDLLSDSTALRPNFERATGSQGFVSGGSNFIGNPGNVSVFTQPGDRTGTAQTPLDPRLTDLGDHGGPTPTHVPLPGSPLIDAVCNLAAELLSFDQRGLPLYDDPKTAPAPGCEQNLFVDIGAVERQAEDVSGGGTRFDFEGDGKADVGIFRPGPGEWWYLRSSDNMAAAFQFGTGTDTITPADFTGDGRTDIAFFRPQTGEWFVLRSEDSSFFSFPFGQQGDIPAPGDFDGDGEADPAVFRPSIATWFYIRSSDSQVVTTQFGLNGDVPIVEDYDGDGMDDIAVYRPSVAEWYLNRSTDGFIGYQFGAPGNVVPAPADYTGDGRTDIAFFNPNAPNGQENWFVLRSDDDSFFAFPFGMRMDVPVPGDYDGDGRADPAVFRPASNTWFLQQTTDGFEAVGFGIAGDVPVPAAYQP